MLRRQLPAPTGGHTDHQRDMKLASGHMQIRGSIIEDLVRCQETEVDRHDLHDRAHTT
jgi:hypothetical protein